MAAVDTKRDRRSSPRHTLDGAFVAPRLAVDHTAAQLLRQVDALSRENRQLADFAHDVAHGLRTPLAVMSGTAEVLCRLLGADLDEDAQAVLAALLNGIKRMDGQIGDLLGGGQPEREPEITTVDCDELVAAVLAQHPELEADVHIEPLGIVRAHRDQLFQVFTKLVHHARQHRPRAGTLWISITAKAVTGGRIVEFSNNGADPVVAHGDLDGDAANMDLVYCRWAVLGHGGRIWVEPSDRGGTVVSFFLPASGA